MSPEPGDQLSRTARVPPNGAAPKCAPLHGLQAHPMQLPGAGVCMRMQAMTLALIAIALAGVAVRSTAQEDEARQVQLIADDFEFDPDVLELPAGVEVELTMENVSTSLDHNLVIELPGGEISFDETVEPGDSATLTFTTPDADAELVFYCPFEDHRDRGMEGRIVVARVEPPSVSRASPMRDHTSPQQGRERVKRAPLPGGDSTCRSPSCIVAMRFAR